MTKSFKTKVERFPGAGTWTYATVPFDCGKEFGTKGRISVIGKINGQDIEAALMPHGTGQHFIILSKEIRDKTKIKVGDVISVSLKKDDAPKELPIPDDFQKALNKVKPASGFFASLAPSHKKEYIKWIEEAKKAETRENRIMKAVSKLAELARLKAAGR